MKFIIENLSKSSGRLGQLVHNDGAGLTKQFKTPVMLQTTKGGSIPYVSREVFEYISKEMQILHLSLCSMHHMAEAFAQFEGSIGAYVGYRDYPTMMTARDPCAPVPSGHNDRDVVPLYSRRGKESVTAERYMDLMETFQPDIYQGLCDADTNLTSPKKRVQKSVDRTENFMQHCYERHEKSTKLKNSILFVPIVGGFSRHARLQSLRHANKVGGAHCGGFIFEGFHNYGFSASELKSEDLIRVMDYCLPEMPADKPRMILGAYTPVVTLELIRLGIDMFDSSYPLCAAFQFQALTFNYQLNDGEQRLASSQPFLDLTDESFKDNFTPVLANCQCLTCQKHTKAYVHHLFKTRELLGPILLMIHNLHHYMGFFEAIHACIARDNLHDLIQLIQFQNGQQEVDYTLRENAELTKTKNDLTKGFNNI